MKVRRINLYSTKGFSMMKKRKNCFITAIFPLLIASNFLYATEPTQPEKQVITSEEQGKIIWADLYTGDVNASVNFYTDTFDWTVKKFGEKNDSYYLLFDGTQPIAGVLSRPTKRNKTETALWVGSISTDNIQTRIDNAATHNATILLKPHDFALYGKRAVIADPQGGVIALLDITNTDQAKHKISKKWNWAQLFSVDTHKAASFYQQTFNYSIDEITENQHNYYLSQQDEVMASIVKLPSSFEQRDRWVNFVEVDNLISTLKKATENGAAILYQPEGRHLAIIADPHGALLGLTEQESE